MLSKIILEVHYCFISSPLQLLQATAVRVSHTAELKIQLVYAPHTANLDEPKSTVLLCTTYCHLSFTNELFMHHMVYFSLQMRADTLLS